MRIRTLIFFIITFTFGIQLSAQQHTNSNLIYIKFKPNAQAILPAIDTAFKKSGSTSFDALTAKYKAVEIKAVIPKNSAFDTKHKQAELHLWYMVRLATSVNTTIIQAFAKHELIAFAEPVYEITRLGSKAGTIKQLDQPTSGLIDPLAQYQWNYTSINLPEVWKIKRNTPEITIALVDRTVDVTHQDIEPNLWKNPNANKLDGYKETDHGALFYDAPVASTSNMMGTATASVLIAQGNNGIGIAGVAGGDIKSGGAKLMLCDISGGRPNLAAALVYAADNGANLIQLNWHYSKPGVYNKIVYDAILYFTQNAGLDAYGAVRRGAKMQGGLVLAAAGDQGSSAKYFPQAFDQVITVGAINGNNQKTNYSNSASVQLWAPGGDALKANSMLLAAFKANKYDTHLGTTLACAQVTGVAALILSQYGGTGFVPEMLKCRLLASAGETKSNLLGGIFNAETAFSYVFPEVTSLVFSENLINLVTGNSHQLQVNISPAKACGGKIEWKSSKTNIASVNASGRVTAISEGICEITASISGYTAKCEIKVNAAKTFKVTGIELKSTTKKLELNEEFQLKAILKPADATNQNLNWVSSKPSAVSVNNGKIKGLICGEAASISVSSEDGNFSAVCVVTVGTLSTALHLSKPTLNLALNEVQQLTTKITPLGACKTSISWESSNPAVAQVDSLGRVKALGCGGASITARTNTGLMDNCEVNVGQKVQGFTLSDKALQMNIGDVKNIVGKVLPANACNQEVEWSSSAPQIVQVDPFGKVTAIACGLAVIKFKTKEGAFGTSCNIEVGKPVSGISLSESKLDLIIGQNFQLKAQSLPAEACNKAIIWKSTNTSAVSIDPTGKLTALTCGSAVVTATTVDGGYQARCTIQIGKSVSGVSLAPVQLHIPVNESSKLVAQIIPADACSKELSWTSNNPAVLSVNSEGVITSHSCGQAIVSVHTVDGGFAARCSVKVGFDLKGISLSTAQLNLSKGQDYQLVARLLPENACQQRLVWLSSQPNVVQVDASGKLKAISCGKSSIKLSSGSGTYSATCEVSVGKPVSGITLARNSLSMQMLQEDRLMYDIIPLEACNKTVNWISSNPAVVQVSKDGKLKAVGKGVSSISVRTVEGNYSAVCRIEVIE